VGQESGEDLRTMRREEVLAEFMTSGHNYYQEKPKKPAELKGLTRLEYYSLYRIRTGADNMGH